MTDSKFKHKKFSGAWLLIPRIGQKSTGMCEKSSYCILVFWVAFKPLGLCIALSSYLLHSMKKSEEQILRYSEGEI